VRLLERSGPLIADPVHPQLDFEPSSSLDHLQAASVHYRIAIDPHAGRKALILYNVVPMEETTNIPLLARVAGFSLHAARVFEAHQRGRLERQCRCITFITTLARLTCFSLKEWSDPGSVIVCKIRLGFCDR